MSKIRQLFPISLQLLILCAALSVQSCNDPCKDVNCENDGICNEGICECAEGYVGTNCERLDPNKVQFWLDGGKTPFELYQANIPLENLYGKLYADGFIFYLNTTDGTGLVAAQQDIGSQAPWGCQGTDIANLNNVKEAPPSDGIDILEGARIGDGFANTAAIVAGCSENNTAAKQCQILGTEWFLPSRTELYLMYMNLHQNGHGNFSTSNWYWSSTERTDVAASARNFSNGSRIGDIKNSIRNVRAAKAFE